MPPLSQIVFKKYDVDGTGMLSVHELSKMCYDMGHPMTQDKLALALQVLDANGDGKFSYEEFKRWWADDHRFQKLEQLDAAWLKAVITHFQYFDKDRSGLIQKAELPALYASLKGAGHQLPAMDHFLANIDVNADGCVSLQEYIDWLKSQAPGGAS